MLNIALCDDSEQDLAVICKYLKKYQNLHKEYEFHVDIYHSSQELLDSVRASKEYDIYFLDILMPGQDGISLARCIRDSFLPGLIIFLTSSPEYSMDAFRVKAMQYLLKPVQEASFFEVLDDAAEVLRKMTARYFTASLPDGRQPLRLSSIVYVECRNRILHFHMSDGQILQSRNIRGSFETEIQPLLNDYRFCRPHHSYVVNLSYAARLLPAEITMNEGSTVPISKKYLKETRKIYLDYLSSQMPEL